MAAVFGSLKLRYNHKLVENNPDSREAGREV
jgi:hypothetical protein